jgi:N-acyl-D-aspartate/D-glutamate deacylase
MPFSCLRGYVLGMKPARERTSVTKDELDEMKRLFREGMQAGAFGIAGNRSAEDHPEDGGYLPSHVASDEEWLALAEVLGEFDVGHLGWDIGEIPMFDDRPQQHTLLTKMMDISGRPLQLILGGAESMAWMHEARAQGLPVFEQVMNTVSDSTFKLAEYNLYDIFPNWVQPLVGTPEERIAKLQDPATRAAMKEDVERFSMERQSSINLEVSRTNWDRVRVYEVHHDRNQKYEGMTINELAQATSKHPVDAYLELALDEQLQTIFTVPQNPADSEGLVDRLKSPYGHLSISDGGAHTRFQNDTHWPIYFLSFWVRDREILSLEQAHYKISTLPAWLASFRDRGSLRVGAWADMMIYDLDKLGMLFDGPMWANDFPGGERRFIRKPTGLNYTIVNGTVTFEGNESTGALPGKLLRSYDMIS